ncbi:Uncharacterised protein [Klebsiella michiganensis]|nr:Uncharacterised protein [Klebsiella michiganensis]
MKVLLIHHTTEYVLWANTILLVIIVFVDFRYRL